MTESLEEFAERVTKYRYADFEEAFEGIKSDFVRASPEQRAQWLGGWDAALAMEDRPTRQTADWISRRRELADLHFLLSKAGR